MVLSNEPPSRESHWSRLGDGEQGDGLAEVEALSSVDAEADGVLFALEAIARDPMGEAEDQFFDVGDRFAIAVAVEVFHQGDLGALDVDLLVKTGRGDDISVSRVLIVRQLFAGDVAFDCIFIGENTHKL